MATVVSSVVLFGTGGCSESSDRSPTTEVAGEEGTKRTTTTAVGDEAQYCALARQLAGERRVAAASARTDEEAQLALQRFAVDHVDDARRLAELAPGAIKAAVATVVAGLERVVAGDTTVFQQKKFFLADRRVSLYDAEQCGIGPTTATSP